MCALLAACLICFACWSYWPTIYAKPPVLVIELKKLVFAEDIDVIYSTPTKNRFCPGSNSIEFFTSDRRECINCEIYTGTDNFFTATLTNLRVGRGTSVENLDFSPKPKFIGRCLSAVFENHADVREDLAGGKTSNGKLLAPPVYESNRSARDKNVRTQLALGRFLGDADRPIRVARVYQRGAPQAIGRAPEREGEEANEQSRQGDNSSLIAVGKISRASVEQIEPSLLATDPDPAIENANTFVKGLILFVVFVGVHALAKRFGIIDGYGGHARYCKPKQQPKRPLSTTLWRLLACLRHPRD